MKHIENITDNFCEDTRENAMATLTNLGNLTPSSLDDTMGEKNHFTRQQISRSDRSSDRTNQRSDNPADRNY